MVEKLLLGELFDVLEVYWIGIVNCVLLVVEFDVFVVK